MDKTLQSEILAMTRYNELATNLQSELKTVTQTDYGTITNFLNGVILNLGNELFEFNFNEEYLAFTLKNFKLSNYPNIDKRIKQSVFSFQEVADFMKETGYSAFTLKNDLIKFTDKPLRQLDYWLDKNLSTAISGGFCAAFGQITANLEKVKTIKSGDISSIASLSGIDVSELTDGLNLSTIVGATDKMGAIIDQVKSKIQDQLQQYFKKALDKFSKVKTRVTSVIAKVMQKYNELKKLFSGGTIDSLKQNLQSITAQITGQFEKMTGDNAQHVLYKMCQMMQSAEGVMTKPMNMFKSVMDDALETISTMEQSATESSLQRAAYAGVFSLTPAQVSDYQSTAFSNLGMNNLLPVQNGFGRASPGISGIENGSPEFPYSNSRPIQQIPTTEEEIEAMNFDDNGNNKYFSLTPEVKRMGENVTDAEPGDGWGKIKPEVWVRAMLMSKQLGKKLIISSAYRSPEYNSKRSGSGRTGPHTTGMALDISCGSQQDQANMVKLASLAGFIRIGVYRTNSNFIHVDMVNGGKGWNGDKGGGRKVTSGPSLEAWRLHMSGQFHHTA